MVIYIITLLYWIFLYLFNPIKNKPSKMAVLGAIFPLFLIMALKSTTVGVDTISYVNRYDMSSEMRYTETAITEQGYNFLNILFHDYLHFPFQLFYAVMAAFICFSLGAVLRRYSTNIYLSLFLYMTIGMFTMSMSGLRQTLAVSVCNFVPILLQPEGEVHGGRKRIMFIVSIALIALAFTIHNSAIVFLPTVFLTKIRLTKAQVVTLFVLAISMLIVRDFWGALFQARAFGRYESYDFTMGYDMNILVLLLPIVIGFFCVICHRTDAISHRFSPEVSMFFVYMAFVIFFVSQGLNHGQITRLAFYFYAVYPILIPSALSSMPQSIRNGATLFIIVLCVVFFVMGSIGGTLQIDNYKFFWQETVYSLH